MCFKEFIYGKIIVIVLVFLWKATNVVMDRSEKLKYFKLIMWDSSISPEDVMSVFEGSKSHINNFDRSALIKRVLESFPWFTIIELFTPRQVKELLSEELVVKLR